MERYLEVMVALSESVMENSVKRPLAAVISLHRDSAHHYLENV